MPLPVGTFSNFGGLDLTPLFESQRLRQSATANNRALALQARDQAFRHKMAEQETDFNRQRATASDLFRNRELDATIADRTERSGLAREQFEFGKGTTDREFEQRARKQRMDEMFRGRDADRLEKNAEVSRKVQKERLDRGIRAEEAQLGYDRGRVAGEAIPLETIPDDPKQLRDLISIALGGHVTDHELLGAFEAIERRRQAAAQADEVSWLDRKREQEVRQARAREALSLDAEFIDATTRYQDLQARKKQINTALRSYMAGVAKMTPEQVGGLKSELAEMSAREQRLQRIIAQRRAIALHQPEG